MGNFINTLPVRFNFNSKTSIDEVLNEISQNLIEIRKASTSYYEIKQLLKLKPNEELFNTLFVIENYPINEKKINANEAFNISLESTYEHVTFPIVFTVFLKEQLEIEILASSDVSSDYVSTIGNAFITILDQLSDTTKIHLEDIKLLSKNEQNRLLSKANDTFQKYEKDLGIIDIFNRQVKENNYSNSD